MPVPRHAGILILPQRQHLAREHLAQQVAELLIRQPDPANRLFEWTVGRDWVLDEVY